MEVQCTFKNQIILNFAVVFSQNCYILWLVILFLQLPKHKSVVVTLNDSDDSESDAEQPNSTSNEFGGLESMIKEARRTVEVNGWVLPCMPHISYSLHLSFIIG